MLQCAVSRLALASLVGLVAGNGAAPSYASDIDDVKSAVDGYHRAISSLDLAKIDSVWVHSATVVDKEPTAKTITVGWEGTRKNFEDMTALVAKLSIEQAEGPNIQIQGDLAWSVGISKAASVLKTGRSISGDILEADVFKKQDGRRLLVSHLTSIVPTTGP